MRVALLSLELIQVCGHLAARDTALAEATAGLRRHAVVDEYTNAEAITAVETIYKARR